MVSLRFCMFLLVSLAGHAALLVPLSAYMPALLDDKELQAETVMVSISVVSRSKDHIRQGANAGVPYQPIDSIVVQQSSAQVGLEQDLKVAATTTALPEPLLSQKTMVAMVDSEAEAVSPAEQQQQNTDTVSKTKPSVPDSSVHADSNQQSAEAEANRRRRLVAEERYLTELLHAIAQHRFYPPNARRKGQQGSVEIDLTILQNGEFESIAVSKPSSHRILNKASSRTLNRLKRFKPFPSDIDRESWRISIPFRYVLNAGKDKRS